MNRFDKENCKNQILGYYAPPSVSDPVKSSTCDRFESAKMQVIEALKRNIENIEKMNISDVFPKYKEK